MKVSLMDEEKMNFDDIMSILNDNEFDPIKTLAVILAMPDEEFEVIKPVFIENIEKAFNSPEAIIGFSQLVNQYGIKIEDLAGDFDKLIESVDELSDSETKVSESKKDLIKFIFSTFINTMESTNTIPHRVINIPIKLCRENAKLPAYATNGSAAMDIYSPEEYTIAPGETIVIPTGLKVNIPIGYALIIQPRSGMSRKTKLRIANTPGLIDSDYHEEIGVIVENIDPPIKDVEIDYIASVDINGISRGSHPEAINRYGSSYTINKGERFAQMRLIEVPLINWLQVNSLGTFENDHGAGFGSTGTN